MHNLDDIVRMYYSAVSVPGIIKGIVKYEDFPPQEFAQLSKAYIKQHSDTENRQLYAYAKSSENEEGHPLAGMENRSCLNVFAALEELAEQLLTLEGNEVKCVYGNLLRFREVTKYIDEDLLVCAYHVVYHRNYGRINTDFAWDVTIGHNNLQLRRIMERGISENHFHLYGAAPIFHLRWIYFMNHVDSGMLSDFAHMVEERQRVTREHYSISYSEESFEVRLLKAALMRAHIMLYLLRKELPEDPDAEIERKVEKYNAYKLLSGELDIRAYYYEIQKTIDRIRNYVFLLKKTDLTDYAIYMVEGLYDATTEKYWFAGERWMMYKMLSEELSGQAEKYKDYFQWFYAYLVLKHNIRDELLQVNDTVGFENFSIYSKRKKNYVDYEKMIEAAIYGSVETGNIQSLEIRITPKKGARDCAQLIRDIDDVIGKRKKKFPQINYYYVFHFPKEADIKIKKEKEKSHFEYYYCRHYKKRRDLEGQAYAIADFRDKYRKMATEVLGIDACSQEIGCRPEVFAPVFRYLSKHIVERVEGVSIDVPQLKKTFHVGEDFLDIVDGLRAVDEAIHFLDLQCGDRIGHGTVLGINVRNWYHFKGNTILLSKQDYLDNIVWLYHKLAEYRIDGMDSLRSELLKEFEIYFAEVYLLIEGGNRRENLRFNIDTYYEAWKLRGDDPELYSGGLFDNSVMLGRTWLVNRRYPERFQNREHDEIAYLYYLYHYDKDVKENGRVVTQIYVPLFQIEGICAIQKAMQKEVAALGIGIETNPSSNFAISPIQGYEEHPIVCLYNKDMTWDVEKIRNCPQMNVSINTDDKGIFHTSLENEYALMACAMEKVKDERGMPLYNRQMIYQWIDNIREMGNMQSFKEQRNQTKKQKAKVGEHGRSIGKDNAV